MIVSTQELLQANAIRNAIVVDDAYDRVPKAADIAMNLDEWNIFLDDLTNEDVETLRLVYPAYESGTEDRLFLRDDFIACLWNGRDNFRAELIDPLFETYDFDSAHDLRFVQAVEAELGILNVAVRTVGREFVEDAASADLIVIDLFLGAQQTESDMRISLDGLAEVVKMRVESPPVIVLMSRSGRLMDQADAFRDGAKVFASGFRTIVKADIEKPGRLEQLVRELARHRRDSLKLNSFLLGWSQGVSGAMRRTEDDIRRLDLEDWAQIHDLLLASEGSSAGRYILEVLEFSFLHELESENAFLGVAVDLDTLDRAAYPPTTIAGSKDTLGLVAKTLYEHENCRQLEREQASPVGFGDIVGPIHGREFPEDSVFSKLENAVLIAMTPACDLQRGDVERILFLVGETKGIDAPATGSALLGFRTPILHLPDGKRVWVDWQRNHVLTLTKEEVHASIASDGNSMTMVARLRTANAVSLQQQLLSSLGRVGLVAPVPSTFPVQVTVYYPSGDGVLTSLRIGGGESIVGVCYAGRRNSEKSASVALDSSHRYDFLDSLDALGDDQFHNSSAPAISGARQASVVDLLFSRGVRFDPEASGAQQWKESVGGEDLSLGRIVYGKPVSEVITTRAKIIRAGLVLEIRDPSTIAGEQ